MADQKQQAYCTLLMSDDYLPGAMVLAHSLRDGGTKRQLIVLITPDSLQPSTISELKTVYDHIVPVDRIANKSPANLYLMNRPDLLYTFTKLALWRQMQFEHIVYLDADTLALRAPEELFDTTAPFAAVPDIGWPDCFNSGVLSLKPNMGEYYALLALAQRGISFDGADQGLLNTHFRTWHRLSFTYNCTPSGNYQYLPAYRHFQSSISVVHYIGDNKPWRMDRDSNGAFGVYEEMLGRWWSVYDKHHRTPTASPTTHSVERLQLVSETVQHQVHEEVQRSKPEVQNFKPEVQNTRPDSSLAQSPTKELTDTNVVNATEKPPENSLEPAQDVLHQDQVDSIPAAQQRRYSVEWDPIRQPPPAKSRPEASNFPSQIYQMSQDRSLFQAPSSYPEPPKGMYYEVPPPPPAVKPPKPIFPWETTQAKATRVFAEDTTSSNPVLSTAGGNDTRAQAISPFAQVSKSSFIDPFTSYNLNNAWDDMPEIERYISHLGQNRQGKVQVLSTRNAQNASLSSAGGRSDHQKGRRPTMKITDFPTDIERPSLPVTPAPDRKPSFWGNERDSTGELPAAEGVPQPLDWNPTTRLEELQRRQSEVLAQLPGSRSMHIVPDRENPDSTSVNPESAGETEAAAATDFTPTKPSDFRALDSPELSPTSSGSNKDPSSSDTAEI